MLDLIQSKVGVIPIILACSIFCRAGEPTRVPIAGHFDLGPAQQFVPGGVELALAGFPAPHEGSAMNKVEWSPAGHLLGFVFFREFYAAAPGELGVVRILPDRSEQPYTFNRFWWASEDSVVLHEVNPTGNFASDLRDRYVLVELTTGQRLQTATPTQGGFRQVVGVRSPRIWYVDCGAPGMADVREFDPFSCTLSTFNLVPSICGASVFDHVEACSPWLSFVTAYDQKQAPIPPPYVAGAVNVETGELVTGQCAVVCAPRLLASPQRWAFYGLVPGNTPDTAAPARFDLISGMAASRSGDTCAGLLAISSVRDSLLVALVNGDDGNYAVSFEEVPLSQLDR